MQSLFVAVYVIGRKENGHISFIKYFEYAYTKQIRTAELVIAGIKNQWLISKEAQSSPPLPSLKGTKWISS